MSPAASGPRGRILIVDDDHLARQILAAHLDETAWATETASGGHEALERLSGDGPTVDAILLDWNMPELSGIELLKRIKNDPDLQMIPVILQSARNHPRDLAQGIAAGAYYYLEKPVHAEMLRQVLSAALRDHRRYEELQSTLAETRGVLDSLQSALFEIRTITEARALAALLSHTCPQPEQTVVGLGELMVNAVEHGNLGITYDEKSRLLGEGTWEEEVQRRLELSENQGKRVRVEFERRDERVCFRIVDEGRGFEWDEFLEIRPERLLDPHGRGIALARALCFDSVEYTAPGNEVFATVRREDAESPAAGDA